MMRRSLLSLVLAIWLFGGAPLVRTAHAEVFPSTSATLSTHATSTVANHTFAFVTRRGFLATGNTLTIIYASGFTLTGIAVGDVDLAQDDNAACDGPWTDKTLESGASPSAGAWGVAVSGQSIVFTSSATISANIPASRCVQVQIGTNASGGSGQIVNPGSAGSYEIDIVRGISSGDGLDHNMLAVAIASPAGVTVSATVPSGSSSSASSSSSTPIAPADTTAPIVSNIVVSSITATSATVTWQTNEPAQRTLSYGTTTAYASGSLTDSLFRTSHTQTLSGLVNGTQYHFQIVATDASGNAGTSPDTTFTTLDTQPPTISGVSVTGISETAANINWTTNESSTSRVVLTPPSSGLAIELTDLTTAHTIAATGLLPNTAYTVAIESTDASGNTATTTTSFTTLVDLPPTNVTGFSAVTGPAQIALSWTNPADGDLAGVIIVVSATATPTSVASGTVIFNGLASSYVYSGLVPGRTYYFTLFVVDAAGNLSSGASVSAIAGAVASTPTPTPLVVPVEEDVTPTTDDATDTTPSGDTADIVDVVDVTGDDEALPHGAEDEDIEPLPPTTVDGVDALPRASVTFSVARDTILIEASRSTGTLHVLGGRSLAVQANLQGGEREVLRVELRVGDETYLMNPDASLVRDRSAALVAIEDEAIYSARVMTPSTSSPLGIVIYYLDGAVQSIPYALTVLPDGLVSPADEAAPLESATVTLMERAGDWRLFNAPAYAQANPVETTGAFAWYVPNGTYRVEVLASGYTALTSAPIVVHDHVVNPSVRMLAALPPFEEAVAEVLDEILRSDAPIGEKAAAVARVIADRGVQTVRIVRQDPTVQASATVAAPVTMAVAATTATTLAVSFNAARFVHYLFTAPFLLVNRRRRKQWGVVYDSLRKVPVDLAIVRMRDRATDRLVKSRVTDREGRYLFVADPGRYTLEVSKAGFTYPSAHLKEQKRDGQYLDLYHGEELDVTERSATIAANIPLDPVGARDVTSSWKVRARAWLRGLQYVLAVTGVVVAMIVAVIQPSWWTMLVVAIQVAVLLLFVRLARPKKPTGWGIVYDAASRHPLAHAIVRIFEPKYNKLLETQVTDGHGRYAFLVGPSEYYVTYEKPQYRSVEVRPVDRTNTSEPSYISLNVGLEKHR